MSPDDTTRVYVRCNACQELCMLPKWEEGTRCPACDSEDTSPAPVLEDAAEYSLASRETGPTIEDIRLARVVHWLGYGSVETLRASLKEQRDTIRQGAKAPPLGEILVRNGVLRDYQLNAILRTVRADRVPTSWQKFGAFAVNAKFVTDEQLQECAQIQIDLVDRGHDFPFIGNLFVEMGCCKENDVLALLKAQRDKRNEGLLKDLQDAIATEEGRAPKKKGPRARPASSVREKILAGLCVAAIAVSLLLLLNPGFFTSYADKGAWVYCGQCRKTLRMSSIAWRCPVCKEAGLEPVVRCSGCGEVFRLRREKASQACRCPNCRGAKYDKVRSRDDIPAF